MGRIFILLFIYSIIAQSKELVDRVAATAGKEVLLLSELNGFATRIDRVGSIDETLMLGQKTSALKENKSEQLQFLIREKILENEIKRLGFGITEAQVDSEMAQMAKRGSMSLPDFETYLTQQGYTTDEYKIILRNRIERQSFFEREIISKLRITDEDALSVYQNKNPGQNASLYEYKIAQIFFSNKKSGAQKAAERAEAAFKRLNAGETFDLIAQQLDETPGSGVNGLLGTFKTGEFIPAIEKAFSQLNEGGVSSITQGPSGFHIVKLITKKTILDPRFAKVKESIKAGLVQQNFERQLKNWFELKKTDLDVKVYDKAL